MPYPVTVDSGLILTFFNVKDGAYGAKGNGVTDDTAAIAAAIAAAAAAGGGIVFFPAGIYITGNQTLNAYVNLLGAGITATTIRLKAGANTDLFSAQTSSINLAAAANTGPAGTLFNFTIRDMTLDGNKANQTGGPSWPLRFYGYNFHLRDLEVTNGYSGGIQVDWNATGLIAQPSDEMEGLFDSVKTHDHNGVGLQLGGPHDSALINVFSFNNSSHGFHFAPNATGILCTQCHPYHLTQSVGAVSMLIESVGCQLVNCMIEGSDTIMVAAIANNLSIVGGSIFGFPGWAGVGVQLGQVAGATPIAGQILQSAGVTTAVTAGGCFICTTFLNCLNAISFKSDLTSQIFSNVYQTTGSAIAGTPSQTDVLIFSVSGLAPDGTLGKSGGMQFSSSGNPAFNLLNAAGAAIFQASGASPGGIAVNAAVNSGVAALIVPGADTEKGVLIYPYSATQSAFLLDIQNSAFADVFTVDKSGNTTISAHVGYNTSFNVNVAHIIATGSDTVTGLLIYANSATQSSPLITLQNSVFANMFTVDKSGNVMAAGMLSLGQSATAVATATSGTIATASIGNSRVSPAAAVTGVILAAGTVAGQKITVVNEAALANTITFNATPATSKVATSGSEPPIAGGTARSFTWDDSTALWYPEIVLPVASATAVAIVTSGAIATAGLDISRVAPAGAVTGITLNVGTYMGQTVTVLNEAVAANTITLNTTPATAHVADSATETTIAGTTARTYKWNTSTSLWYLCR